MYDLYDMEKDRRTIFWNFVIRLILSILMFVAAIALMVKTAFPFHMLAILLLVALWWGYPKSCREYSAKVKDVVVNRASNGMFDRFAYDPGSGFELAEIQATGMMMTGNRYSSEDMVVGSYKGVDFRRSDIYIAQHTSSGKSSHTTVYMQGSWLKFSYNKAFKSDLQVVSKDFGFCSKKTSRLFTRATERRTAFETEDTEFNRCFTCTCQDMTEAFYLLTPRLMQAMLQLKSEFNCPVMFGFVNNQLHVAIDTRKNHFEPSILHKTQLEYEIEMARRELKVICNIVDALSIDRRIFAEM